MPTPQHRALGDVLGVQVYKKDVVVHRAAIAHKTVPTVRGEITEFSLQSRRRLAFVACNTSVTFRTMITLTYPAEFPKDGRQVKKNLHAFLTWLQRDTNKCSILWFLEFQARGAPHVHILTDYPIPLDPDGRRGFRFRVSATWYRVCGKLDPKHLAAGTRTERIRKKDGGPRYCCKYAAKMHQKTVPPEYRNVGRFWGCSRDVPPTEPELIRCTEDDIRGVLDGWQYKPGEDRPVYRVLFGCASLFRDCRATEIDKRANT